MTPAPTDLDGRDPSGRLDNSSGPRTLWPGTPSPGATSPPVPGGMQAPPPAGNLPVLEVEYRTAGAFLVAYSAQLSRGELFLEADTPWPAGTRTMLRIHVPGAMMTFEGLVTWTRPEALGPGQPAGMGLGLSPSIEAHGAIVDDLASKYVRTRILVATSEPARRAILTRYLRATLSCDLVEMSVPSSGPSAELLLQPVTGPIDLAVIDLDSGGASGDALITALRGRGDTATVPVIVLAQQERDRIRGVSLGADEALTNPPVAGELQNAVIHVISRPQVWLGSQG